MNLLVCVYAHNRDDYMRFLNQDVVKADFKDIKVIFCDSRKKSRLDYLLTISDQWVLFLDSDCIPTKDFIYKVRQVIESQDFADVAVGFYLNVKNATYLQRAHNHIANTWLRFSFKNPPKYLLGGVFLVFPVKSKLQKIEDQQVLFWGGEDKVLALQLQKVGYKLSFSPQLQVYHDTGSGLFPFLKRSWVQGFNFKISQENLIEHQFLSRIKWKYWFSELGSEALLLAPALLLHFLVLQLGKLARKFHPENK